MAQAGFAIAASSWAVLMGIAPMLQIRSMLRAQSSREVSLGYFTILLIGFLLWVAYGVAAGIPALIIPGTQTVWTAQPRWRTGGICLEVFHSSFADGAPVDHYKCNGTDTQEWFEQSA